MAAMSLDSCIRHTVKKRQRLSSGRNSIWVWWLGSGRGSHVSVDNVNCKNYGNVFKILMLKEFKILSLGLMSLFTVEKRTLRSLALEQPVYQLGVAVG